MQRNGATPNNEHSPLGNLKLNLITDQPQRNKNAKYIMALTITIKFH